MDFSLTTDDDFATLYDIIGCSPLSTVSSSLQQIGRTDHVLVSAFTGEQIDQICTEYKIRALSCHPDKHPGDKDAEQRFKQLQQAKSVLTDPELRKNYDKWLNSGVRVSFDSWLAMNRKGQAFHWVKQNVTHPMIQNDEPVKDGPAVRWERDWDNETLSKFRNYQI